MKDLFKNIKSYFLKIFKKQKIMLEEPKNSNEKTALHNTNSVKAIKSQNKKNQTTKEIIDIIERNPKMLENLNMEQLDVIEEYYRNNISQIKEKTKRVKSEISQLEETVRVLSNQLKTLEGNNV